MAARLAVGLYGITIFERKAQRMNQKENDCYLVYSFCNNFAIVVNCILLVPS